jgi:thiol:disulfide interchange protein DsbA
MNSIRRWTLGALLALSMGSVFGAAQAGKEYTAIDPAQPTDAPGKIEVIEFFSYACPHCNHLEAPLEAWARKLPPGTILRRIPVTFGRTEWVSLAKLHYALETLGKSDELAAKVFHAIHEEHVLLTTPEACADWAAKQGLDRGKFLDAFNSFGVQTKLQRANMKAQTYAIDGVPTLIVDGRFKTSPAMTGGNEGALAVVDELIQTSAKDKAGRK